MRVRKHGASPLSYTSYKVKGPIFLCRHNLPSLGNPTTRIVILARGFASSPHDEFAFIRKEPLFLKLLENYFMKPTFVRVSNFTSRLKRLLVFTLSASYATSLGQGIREFSPILCSLEIFFTLKENAPNQQGEFY